MWDFLCRLKTTVSVPHFLMVAEGDKVAARWRTSATHQGEFRGVSPTGQRIVVEAIGIFRIAGGRVVERWDKYDTPGLWQ